MEAGLKKKVVFLISLNSFEDDLWCKIGYFTIFSVTLQSQKTFISVETQTNSSSLAYNYSTSVLRVKISVLGVHGQDGNRWHRIVSCVLENLIKL